MEFLLLALGLQVSIILFHMARSRMREKNLFVMGKFLGLEFQDPGAKPAMLEGDYHKYRITIEYAPPKTSKYIEFCMKYNLDIPVHFILVLRREITNPNEQAFPGILETGDAIFDEEFVISTSHQPAILIGMLDAETRHLLSELGHSCKYLSLSHHRFIVQIKKWLSMTPGEARIILEKMTGIMTRLTEDITLDQRFTRNIKSDPLVPVHIRNIRALAAYSLQSPGTQEVLKKALENPDYGVQIEAAQHLGGEGIVHLVTLIENRAPLDMNQLIQVVEILGRRYYKEGLPVLLDLFNSGRGNELKTAILETLAKWAHPGANAFLIHQLERGQPELRVPIITALGACGGAGEIESLYRIKENVLNPLIHKAARDAISQIQSRMGPGEKGWLTINITGDKEGGLSNPQDAREGGLSHNKTEREVKD